MATPAETLSRAASAWFDVIVGNYELRPDELVLLRIARDAHARYLEAKERIDADGVVVLDRWGVPKAHPAHAVERDNRAAFMQALRQLGISDEGEPLAPLSLEAARKRKR
jgi:phage terminase small subunit